MLFETERLEKPTVDLKPCSVRLYVVFEKQVAQREESFCFSISLLTSFEKKRKLKRGSAEPTKTNVITGGLVSNGLFAQAAHLTTSPRNKNLSLAKLLLLTLLITKTKSR